jgi:alpha-L-rhamnosidase
MHNINPMKYLIIICFVLFSSAIGAKEISTIQVTVLKCENFNNPLGIETKHPRLSWQLKSDAHNVKQTAYRIIVSDDAKKLNLNQSFIWDSGKTDSDNSILVSYVGSTLQASKQYFWKVMVWDTDGKASDWSKTASWQMGLLSSDDWKNARWIGYEDMPDSMRVVPGSAEVGEELGLKALKRPVVPLFRKEFELKKKIAHATLFISGLGQYEANINGKKIGNGFLTPGWTNYDKTVLYNTYNVTQNLEAGKNVIGVLVGNGFYNINRERYRKLISVYGMPKLICRLKITYSDGSEDNVVSASDWKTSPSAITFTSIYGGEDYDARLEQTNWDKPGFDDMKWKSVIFPTIPKGKLNAEPDYPVAIMESIETKKIQKTEGGKYLYDFEQNASGIIEIKVKGKKGQIIKFTPGELLTPQKEINQKASGGPYYFSYTLKGDGIETWQPKFSYYGFRYVIVDGAVPESMRDRKKLPEVVSINLLNTRNSSPQNGSFQCSNELFNQIYTLINWAIKSNLQSVVTDCPHREKLGWMEQTFLMGNSINYNFDINHLYQKLVKDMIDSQLPNGLVPDIDPELVEFSGGFRDSPEWGSASVILPWLVYKWYGDKSAMEQAWPMMVKYVDYLETKSNNHILSHGLGDWYDLGPKDLGPAQLTPMSLTATSIYYYDLKLLAQMAGILHKEQEATRFFDWSEKVKSAFNAKFLNSQTKVYSTGSQTAMSMPLSFGLVDEKIKDQVLDNLVNSIISDKKALTAGDIGFHYLVETLAKNGKSQLLFDMNARNDVPGYGFQLAKGATSLTESWMANEISSNNHLMLGHLMEWLYSGIGGISQTETSVGFKEIVIKPEMVGDILFANTSFNTPYGMVKCDWEKQKYFTIISIEIPANSSAMVYLPVNESSKILEGGSPLEKISDIQVLKKGNGKLICRIGSGKYSFRINI